MKVKNLGKVGVPPKVARRVNMGPVNPETSVPDTKNEDFFRKLEAEKTEQNKKKQKEVKVRSPTKKKAKKGKPKTMPSLPTQLKEEFSEEDLALIKRQEAFHFKRR